MEKESEEKNIIQINVKSSVKKSINKKSKDDGNKSVREKEDFYSIDVNNTSGRKVNEKVEDSEENEEKENNN